MFCCILLTAGYSSKGQGFLLSSFGLKGDIKSVEEISWDVNSSYSDANSKTVYTFDNEKRLLQTRVFMKGTQSEAKTTFLYKNGELSGKVEITSDSIIYESKYEWMSDSIAKVEIRKGEKFFFESLMKFDSIGRLTENAVNDYKEKYIYDSYSNIIESQHIYDDSEGFSMNLDCEILKFDENGNWIEKKCTPKKSLFSPIYSRRVINYY